MRDWNIFVDLSCPKLKITAEESSWAPTCVRFRDVIGCLAEQEIRHTLWNLASRRTVAKWLHTEFP